MKKLLFFSIIITCSIVNSMLNAQVFQKYFSGTNQWNDFGISGLQDNINGEYTITGYTNSFSGIRAFLLHLDTYGNILWTKGYGGSGTQITYGHKVRQTFEGGYIIAAQKISAGAFHYCAIRTDSNGDTLWTKTWHNSSSNSSASGYPRDVCQTDDGGFIFTGLVDAVNTFGVIRTDADGDILWTKAYGDSCSLGCGQRSHSVRKTADGGFVICGYTFSFGAGSYDAYIIKADGSGNIQWTKTYGTAGDEEAYSIQQTTDGGYIITGKTQPGGMFTPAAVFLIKTNASGDIVWERSYGGSVGELAFSVQQTSDGGYVVAGYTYSFGAGGSDVYLIRTDAVGDTLWTKAYGGASTDIGYSVQQTSDGGFVVTGETSSFGTTGINIYLIKTDANGNSGEDGCNQWTTSTVISAPSFISGSGGGILSSGTTVYGTILSVNNPSFIDSILLCPCNFIITIDYNDAQCNESNGMAWVTVTGGTNPYSFIWDDPLSQTTDTAYNLSEGQYNVTVTDATGCNDSASVVINNSDGPVITVDSLISVDCFGGDDGAIYLNVTGDAQNTFLWSNSMTTEDIDSLASGVYTIAVTDTNNCSVIDSFSITQPDELIINIPQDVQICYGDDAVLTMTSNGGVPPYSIIWSTGSVNQSITVSPLDTTTYYVTATDANGCSASDSVTVSVAPELTAVINALPSAVCIGQSTELTVTGGGDFFQWNTGDTTQSITVTPPSTTVYSVTVTDSIGCSDQQQIQIEVSDSITVTLSPPTICIGDTAVLTVSGGTTYTWSTGDTTQSISVSPSSTTTYSVTVSNELCTGSADVLVTVGQLPVVSAGEDQAICSGESAVLIATGGSEYEWNTGAANDTLVVTPTITTTYYVTVSEGACSGTDEVEVAVNSLPPPYPYGDTTICYGDSIFFPAPPVPEYNIYWSAGDTGSVTVSPTISTVYTVTVSDMLSGCSLTDSIAVNVTPLPTANAGTDQT
ncbi:MAG: hypothetical protein KJ607_00260, partial [Bacteroidetes bacterium]|nr:hypothetical protein [Bacteroidota bacterium]